MQLITFSKNKANQNVYCPENMFVVLISLVFPSFMIGNRITANIWLLSLSFSFTKFCISEARHLPLLDADVYKASCVKCLQACFV